MSGFDRFNNMSADLFGLEIDDVFTKTGEIIDAATGNDDGVFEKIGSVLDDITDNIHISIGERK